MSLTVTGGAAVVSDLVQNGAGRVASAVGDPLPASATFIEPMPFYRTDRQITVTVGDGPDGVRQLQSARVQSGLMAGTSGKIWEATPEQLRGSLRSQADAVLGALDAIPARSPGDRANFDAFTPQKGRLHVAEASGPARMVVGPSNYPQMSPDDVTSANRLMRTLTDLSAGVRSESTPVSWETDRPGMIEVLQRTRGTHW